MLTLLRDTERLSRGALDRARTLRILAEAGRTCMPLRCVIVPFRAASFVEAMAPEFAAEHLGRGALDHARALRTLAEVGRTLMPLRCGFFRGGHGIRVRCRTSQQGRARSC